MNTIKEGLQDSSMYMYEQFKEAIDSLRRDYNISPTDAAKIVMYRERTSVIDHRFAHIADVLFEAQS